jgi:copper(I)-binding protein
MTRRVARSILLGLALGLVLTSCGENPRHRRIDNPVRPDSVSTRIGQLQLQHIRIQRPDGVHAVGDDAGLFLTIDNRGPEDDTLIGVSSVDAQEVILRDGDSEPVTPLNVPIAAGDAASLQYVGHLHLELRGLQRELDRRQFVPVSFRFEQAGVVNVKVFVEGVDHPVVSPLPTRAPAA